MCGITGTFLFNTFSTSYLEAVANSTSKLKHRGPDSQNTKIFTEAALGHTRLAIIDLSENASQPMSIDEGNLHLVFNGEIYNYKELRRDLIQLGHSFTSDSDTEIVLKSYIQWGENCLNKFNGFFAIAIYDQVKRELFIARDRFGIKPIHYSYNENAFCFASELSALLEYPIRREINQEALQLYLEYTYVPAPRSILKDVYKVMPGEYLLINKEKAVLKKEYYSIPENDFDGSYQEAKDELRRLMKESVNRRTVADVPLGTFLSGGVDSSIVSKLLTECTSNVNSFSIGFPDHPFFDESKYSKEVADHIGSNHTVFDLSDSFMKSKLHEVIHAFDEPFADSSSVAIYFLSQMTKDKVVVSLSGDGADEMFAGYNKHRALYLSSELNLKNKLIQSIPTGMLPSGSRNSNLGNKLRQLQKYQKVLKKKGKDKYLQLAKWSTREEVNELMLIDQKEINPLQKKYNSWEFESFLRADFDLLLPNDMLTKVDRMSMANQLEVRTPFLDHELVEFAFSLPTDFKIDSSHRKKILRDTFYNELPEEVFNRSKKGFEVPIKSWLNSTLSNLVDEYLLDDLFLEQQGLFNRKAISYQVEKCRSNQSGDSPTTIWTLLIFQIWFEKYMK